MTATPRLYTERSKSKLAEQGIYVVDMGDYEVYGPELHRLPFAKAVEHRMLSDYRVIVLGVSEASVTPGLRRRLEDLDTSTKRKQAPTTNDMTRVLGVSLAVNGVTEGTALEQPGRLPRAMAFANSILRSKWYADALMESEVLRATTRRMQAGRAMKVVARHLDASASALQRNQELRALARADREDECRVVCNVKLFTEGVDVPNWTPSRSSIRGTVRWMLCRPSGASCARRQASASGTSLFQSSSSQAVTSQPRWNEARKATGPLAVSCGRYRPMTVALLKRPPTSSRCTNRLRRRHRENRAADGYASPRASKFRENSI